MFLVTQPNGASYMDNRASVNMMGMGQGGFSGPPVNMMAARPPTTMGQFMQQPLGQNSQFMPIPNMVSPFDSNMNGMQNYNAYMSPQTVPQFMNQQFQQMPMQAQMANQMQQQGTSQGMPVQGQPQYMQQGGQQFPQMMMNQMLPQNQMGTMQGFQNQNPMMPQFMQQNPMGMMNAMQQYPMGMMNTMQQQMNPMNLQTRANKASANNEEEGFQDDQ